MKFFFYNFFPLTLAVAVFLILQLPIFSKAISYRDEGYLVNSAQLILQGQVPYRDFLTPIAPGCYYIEAFLLKILGTQLLWGRIMYMICVIVILILTERNIRFLQISLPSTFLCLLSIALFFIWPGGFAFYNTYALVAILGTLFLTLTFFKTPHKNSFLRFISPRVPFFIAFLIGVCGALTIVMKQTFGVFTIGSCGISIIVGVWLTFSREKRFSQISQTLFWMAIGMISILGPVAAYFVSQGALTQLLYDCFLFAAGSKQHAVSFLLNRVLFCVPLAISFIFFVRFKRPYKLGLLCLGALLFISYLFFKPARLGRFAEYLMDPLFYPHSFLYLVGIFSLAVGFYEKKVTKLPLFIFTFFLLSSYFGAISSGYETTVIANTTPFLLPLCAYLLEKLPATLAVKQLNFGAFLLLYTLPFLIGPIHDYNTFYNMYSLSNLTAHSELSSLKGISISPQEKDDLETIDHYLEEHASSSDTLLCFPYCPMMNFLLKKQSNLTYTFFYFEAFRPSSQTQLITEMENQHTTFLLTQKPGYIEPEGALENEKLPQLITYFHQHYIFILETANFTLYKRAK